MSERFNPENEARNEGFAEGVAFERDRLASYVEKIEHEIATGPIYIVVHIIAQHIRSGELE